MTKYQVIKRAEQLDDMFNKFKAKCKELVEVMNEEDYDYITKFYVLRSTLENIIDFDLEDSILDAKDEFMIDNNKTVAKNDRICRSCYWWNMKDHKCENKFKCERKKKL